MANYVKFKQGLKKDFNTTNQPLTNGMIYFVIDENNNGSIYYDTIVDGKKATKNGTVHRVKFSGLPIKITGSVIGTGVISQNGETIEINTATNHSHGLAHQDFTVTLSDDDTNLKWTRLGNQNGEGFWLKSVRGNVKAPAWFQPNNGAGVAFGGGSTKGIISVKYDEPSVKFAGGNGDAPVWYFTITGANNKSYDLSKIGGHSSDSAKLDHNVTFKIASTADATKGGNGTTTNLSGAAVDLYLPVSISGFNLLQATRFQGNADSATYATSAGYAKGLFLNPETRQEDMNFNLADTKYIKRVTYSMATSTTKKNKPPVGDANILSFGWDNSGYGSQLAIQNGNAGHLAVRGSGSDNGASSWGKWSTVLDSSNYTSYVNNYYWANIKVSTTSSTETKPTFNTAYTSNWWRSTGKTGWWNDTYSGGIAMEDKIYVKVAGNKSFLIPNGSLKIGGDGNIFFATGNDNATLKIYGQTNTEYGIETIAIQTCFDNQDPQISTYTTQYANRCNLLLQPKGGQVYIGKNLTTVGDTGYKLLVDGNQWTSGSQWVNGNLLFTDITGNTADTGMSLKGVYGRIGGNNGWRIAGGARANNAGYFEIATCDDMNEPIYVRQYGGGGDWNGYIYLARTFTLLDAAGRSRAPELFEAKKVHVNSLLDQSVAITDIGYQFQVTGTSNFTGSVDISGVTTHHNHIQIDTNYSIAKPGKNSTWFGSHNNAMIRMTSVNYWSPLLAQKTTNGYWILGHYNHYNEKDEKDKNSDFRNQWVFGYLSDSNLEGTTGASNSLTTAYRLLNIGGNNNQRMFVSAIYNAAVGSGTQPVYVQNNGNVAACSYSLSATIEAGTANRMAYYKAANQIGSSGHYVTSSQVGINASSSKNYTFYVGGDSLFDNAVTINGNVHILPDTDVGLNAAGSLVIGNKSAQNMGIDGNEIMARNNSKASALYLNNEGGTVQVGKDGITIQAKASSTSLQSGGLRISSETAGNHGNVALELYRGNNGSWQIANEGASLYFRTNWIGEKKATYAKNTLIIDDTTGSASLPYLAIGQEDRNTTYGLYVVSSQSWIKNTLWTGNVYPDVNNTRECGTNNYFWNKMSTNWLNVNRGNSDTDGGITLFGGDINYGIIFRTTKNQGTHGYVSGDWATYFTMSNSAGRGWIFKRWGVGNVASISTDGNAYFNGHIRAASTGSSLLDGQRYNYGGYNLLDATDSGSYWPWLRQTNTNTKKWFSFGILSNSFYLIGSSTNRADNGYDFGWQFDISNGNTTFNANGNKDNTSTTVINGRLIVNPYYSTEQSYSEGIKVNRARNGWANIILGGDNRSSTGTSSTTWLIGHRGSNGTNSGSGGANGANLAGKINDLTIEVNGSSGQGLTLPATQGELVTWQQRPIMAQLPAQGSSTTILSNANYKTAYLATTSNGNASMGLASTNWYHVMNFRHLDNNGYNSQFVLPLSHNGQAAWRFSSRTTWQAWNYIFDDHHAMVPASNNAYNIGSTSNYWAIGYINTLYIAGNAYANGSNRIPTTGNSTGTVGSATVPVYSDNGVLKTITSYSGNAATATVASKLSTNAGSSTIPVYFSGGVPVQCSNTLGVNISGNAAKATYTTQLLGVQNNGSNTPYSVAEGNLIRAVWNVKGDSRWYLKAGSHNCRVNYADNAVDADTVDGYHASDLFSGGYKTTVDLSSLNNNLYYPVTGVSIPANGYHKIKVSVHLNSGTKPSWATHSGGFTTNVELYTTAYGWGATQGETIILNDSYNFTNCGQVVGFTQNGNNSVPVLWLKGGGKYFVECDYNALWTTRTSLYYTYGKAGDTYTQTVEPQSSYPGFKAGNGGAINGTIRAGQVYGAVWNDYAEYRQTEEYIQPGYCVIETGKGDLIKSFKRLQPGANIVSDTFGFAIGETEQTKTPLAVSGRVLAYPYEDRDSYQAGDPVCSGPNGTISKMTREEVREYPDRIIGTVSEIPNYEVWGTGNVKVNNRIWIKVK